MRPRLVVFDVNETLSDLTPLEQRFADLGLDRLVAHTWFAGVLRDGLALTVHGENPAFAELGRDQLGHLLAGVDLDRSVDDAAAHVLDGFLSLPCHPDVVPGITAMADAGLRLVTLSNGAAAVAQRLLGSAGIADRFEHLLSVADAPTWKPDARAYRYALDVCGVAAEDALMVAVHPWDTDGAQRAGLRAAWLNRDRRRYPTSFRDPDLTATSLVDLARELAEVGVTLG